MAANLRTKGTPTPVRVRMYRQGLGDCFLVTFDPGGLEKHVLIDCGSLGATTTGVKLEDVVDDIRQTTDDHIHLVIATHEHKDHVCGFRSENEAFKLIKVDHVWMAWTEDPKDELAQEIQTFKNDLGESLAIAAKVLVTNRSSDPSTSSIGLAVQSLLGFVGEDEEVSAALKDGLAKTIDEAMTFVRKGFKVKARYLKPGGAAIEEAWNPGFRFYVLGPPRSLNKLRNMGSDDSDELFHISAGLRAGIAFSPSDGAVSGEHTESEMPFDPRFRHKESDPRISPNLASYFSEKDNWRRIDNDWLHCTGDLALQLDSMTNNTSLALAIERVSDGKVLLFPADAQEGNWLSWHDPETTFTFKSGRSLKKKTAAELLDATVFYKVGHHSSHNATAKGKGLDLMSKKKELVAFIPVDRKVALGRSPKGTWRMPARALYRALLDKCQGRVVRSDLGWAENAENAHDKKVEKELLGLADTNEWGIWKAAQLKAEQKSTVVIKSLYVDYLLK